MTNPTLFGLAGGEAGPEAILPLDKIQGYFNSAVKNVLGNKQGGETNINLNIENFNNERKQDIEELSREIAYYISRKKFALGGR